MSAPSGTIPYEKQADPQTGRMCGAACLSMVYRSFGKEVPQVEIWPAIAKQNQAGSLASTTHLMAKDALSRGLAAVAIQARHPLQALRLCHEGGIRAILNHRLQANSATGHYTVMVDLDGNDVVLHDPSFGPSRRLSQAELLALWQPYFSNSEIVGNVLIAIAADPPPAPACQFCHTLTPPSIDCPRCKKPIALSPGAVLGCMKQDCIARMWSYICCPSCDFMVDSSSLPVRAAAGAPSLDGAAAGDATEPPSLNKMFEEMDKFCNQVQSLPSAANHAELQQQIRILSGTKAALRLALAEAAVYGQMHKDQLAAFVQGSEKRAEDHRKKTEELNRPTPPLDGNALGRALLKNLGFLK
jgi:hypothetical protein